MNLVGRSLFLGTLAAAAQSLGGDALPNLQSSRRAAVAGGPRAILAKYSPVSAMAAKLAYERPSS